MAIGSSGALSLNATIGVELGESAGAKTSISRCATGAVATINTNSSSYPNSSQPHAFSEWYSYDHSASAGLSGDYGNSVTIFSSNAGTSIQTYSPNLSSGDYAGSSIIGETGHIYFRMESHPGGGYNPYKQDAQLYSIDYDGGGYHTVGNALDGTWGYSQWKTTTQTTNSTYNHGASWSTVTTGSTAGKWNHDTNNTPSGSTGVDVGSTGCIYYEGSGGNAYNKDVYLRSKEVTFQANVIKTRWYHYGAGFANPARVYMGIYIT